MKKQYSSKQRKIHKLKRENVVLGQKRSYFLDSFELKGYLKEDGTFWITQNFRHFDKNDIKYISNISERIGKNSAKIQRLRTLIQQEKTNGTK